MWLLPCLSPQEMGSVDRVDLCLCVWSPALLTVMLSYVQHTSYPLRAPCCTRACLYWFRGMWRALGHSAGRHGRTDMLSWGLMCCPGVPAQLCAIAEVGLSCGTVVYPR